MTDQPARDHGPTRSLLRCREYGAIPVEAVQVLNDDGSLNLTDHVLKRFVNVDFKGGALRVTAKGFSGIFELTDSVIVQVFPRFPIANFSHMVSVCGYSPEAASHLRSYDSSKSLEEWSFSVLADAFLTEMERLLQNGLFRTYTQLTSESSYPRGRIDFNSTVARFSARGINYVASSKWFEKSRNNAPNQCLLAALRVLHERISVTARSSRERNWLARIAFFRSTLSEIVYDRHSRFLNDPFVSGRNALPESREYYRNALSIAVAIVEKRGLDLDSSNGPVHVNSMMVKTEDLFEDFVRASLQSRFESEGILKIWDGNVHPGKRPLYKVIDRESPDLRIDDQIVSKKRSPNLTPDILFVDEFGNFPIVADVKYTNVRNFADRSEVEQVVTYGVRYGSGIVMTIHPRLEGTTSGLVIAGRIGKVDVVQYRIDLSSEDLEAEMDKMADSLRRLVRWSNFSTSQF